MFVSIMSFLSVVLLSLEQIAKQMSPWMLLAGALAAAAVVGLLALRLRKMLSPWIAWPISVLLSLLTFIITAVLAIGISISIPTTDSPDFAVAPRYAILVSSNASGKEVRMFEIDLTFLPNVSVDSDAVLTVSLVDLISVQSREEPVTAAAAPELTLRTPHQCGSVNSVNSAAQNSVCSIAHTGTFPNPAKWIYRTSKAGGYLVTLDISTLLKSVFEVSNSDWYAKVSKNGVLIGRYIREPIDPNLKHGNAWSADPESWGRSKFVETTLDSSNRAFKDDSVEVDLGLQQLEVRLSAQTTLGVSATVYGYMSIAATVLSAALGGGWLWQLLILIRKR